MFMALHDTDVLAPLEADVRKRPNGLRVQRLIREVSVLDGWLALRLRRNLANKSAGRCVSSHRGDAHES